MYENKYEWHGSVAEGDCSLRVREANIEYDNGVWQCQVTASDFTQRDTLISEGAELVVRGEQSRCGKLTPDPLLRSAKLCIAVSQSS